MANSKDKIEYSVVIPVYNEEENAELLYRRNVEALDGMNRPYEIVFVQPGDPPPRPAPHQDHRTIFKISLLNSGIQETTPPQ